jgi:predicted amino acid dehydrogenase
MNTNTTWFGPDSLERWSSTRTSKELPKLDVVLVTHPRDADDLPRMFPWSTQLTSPERRALLPHLKPIIGEIVEASGFRLGILFLPALAEHIISPHTRGRVRRMMQEEALPLVAKLGARHLSLGGLTGSLTGYGRRLQNVAFELGIDITTGHSVTAVSVARTLAHAWREFDIADVPRRVALLGVGSVGRAASRLIARDLDARSELVLIDTPVRSEHLSSVANELRREVACAVSVELTSHDGRLTDHSACYAAHAVVSAVSTPNVIDPRRVASGTILVDDSQPYCWSRSEAWARASEMRDIAPCEAGLIDCRTLGYRSYFPFDFADHDEHGSVVSWSCAVEGMLRALNPDIEATLGEPTAASVEAYERAFDDLGLTVPFLQCGAHPLPIDDLASSIRAASHRPVLNAGSAR